MKKISLIIFLIILNFGCEKVVEIDLDFNEKRYVIDAKINKHVSSDKAFSEVRIRLRRQIWAKFMLQRRILKFRLKLKKMVVIR